jgi:hypothetical protein
LYRKHGREVIEGETVAEGDVLAVVRGAGGSELDRAILDGL